MADVKERAASDDTFVVDKAYLKNEAREAAKTFLAPFTGVVKAFRDSGLGGRVAHVQYTSPQDKRRGVLKPRKP